MASAPQRPLRSWTALLPEGPTDGRPRPTYATLLRAAFGLGLSMVLAAGAASACDYTGGARVLDLPGAPFAAQPTADGCWIFVSLSNPGGISVFQNIDGGFRLVRTLRLPTNAMGLALAHSGQTLVAATEDSATIIDVAGLERGEARPVLGRVKEADGAIDVAITPNDGLLFVSDETANLITVTDLHAVLDGGFHPQDPIGRIGLTTPVGMAVSPDGSYLYATGEASPGRFKFPERCGARGFRPEGQLLVVDIRKVAQRDFAEAAAQAAAAGCNPVRVALSAGRVWVTARGENALLGFNLSPQGLLPPHQERWRIPVGQAPVGLAMDPDGGGAWVSDSNRFALGQTGTVEHVSFGAAPVRKIFQSGRFPRDLRLLPDGRTVIVALARSHQIQLLSMDSAAQQPGVPAP